MRGSAQGEYGLGGEGVQVREAKKVGVWGCGGANGYHSGSQENVGSTKRRGAWGIDAASIWINIGGCMITQYSLHKGIGVIKLRQ